MPLEFSDEDALLLENTIRQNTEVVEANRLLREEIARSNGVNRGLLEAIGRRVEVLAEAVQNGQQRRRYRRLPAIKVPKLCAVSLRTPRVEIIC